MLFILWCASGVWCPVALADSCDKTMHVTLYGTDILISPHIFAAPVTFLDNKKIILHKMILLFSRWVVGREIVAFDRCGLGRKEGDAWEDG